MMTEKLLLGDLKLWLFYYTSTSNVNTNIFFFCITNLCQDCLLKQQYNVLY